MRFLLGTIATVLLATSCGKVEDSAGLGLLLDTDMAVPAGIAQVGLYIQHIQGGNARMVLAQEEAPLYDPVTNSYRVSFSATLNVQTNGTEPQDKLRARFIGYDALGQPVAMREVRANAPQGVVRFARMPLLFVNAGLVDDTSPGLVQRGEGLALAQESPRGDVFTRYRMRGCGEDETRDDLGRCRSIDLSDDELLTEEPTASSCFPTDQCFAGPRGVRRAPLVDCTANVPPVDGVDSVALAFPGFGFEAGADEAQPLDGALYTYSNGLVTLGPELCAQAQARSVSEVLVSVKCAAKASTTPICAAYRPGTPPLSATDDGFPDDPPPPPDGGDPGDQDASSPDDATVPEDASTPDDEDAASPDDGGSPDASDGGGPLGDSYTREVTVSGNELLGFAIDEAKNLWLLMSNAVAGTTASYAAADVDGATEVPTPAGTSVDYAQRIQLGPALMGSRIAYLLPEFPTYGSNLLALKPTATVPQFELIGFGPGCDTGGSRRLSVTLLNDEPVALLSTSSATHVGRIAGDPLCFQSLTEAYDSTVPTGPGAQLGANVYFGVGSDRLMRVGGLAAPTLVSVDLGGTGEVRGVLPLTGGRGLLVTAPVSGPTTGFVYDPAAANGPAQLDGNLNDAGVGGELYAGNDIVCGRYDVDRMLNSFVSRCHRIDGNTPQLLNGAVDPQAHLYGDENYLYSARLCGPKVYVRAVRWDRVGVGPGSESVCPDLPM